MGGLKLKGRSGTFLFLIVVMNIVFLIEHLEGSSALINNPNISCNGTVGDCFFGNEDEIGEFLRYSVGGRWLLQAKNHISYDALQTPPACNAAQYSNCIVPINAQNRPCTEYNHCKRAA